MTDIAQLGFKVDTGDLDKATDKLGALQAAANGMSSSAEKTAAAVEGSNIKILNAITARAQAEKTAANAALLTLKNTVDSSEADKAAALTLQKKTAEVLRHAQTVEQDAKAIIKATAAQKTQTTVQSAAAGKNGISLAVNNGKTASSTTASGEPNRFNTANVAAQFHDVAVTAAMGMNPMTIALQQGTQLSAVLNTMKDPLKGIGAAFAEIFNAISIGTIAFVALLAVGLQMINWSKVALVTLNAFAAGVLYLAPLLIALGVAFAAVKWQAFSAGVITAVTSLRVLAPAFTAVGAAAAAAWAFIITPVGLVVAAITAVVAAVLYMTGWFTKASDIIKKWADSIFGAGKYAKEFRDDIASQTDEMLINQKTLNMNSTQAEIYANKQRLLNKAIADWDASNKNADTATRRKAIDEITLSLQNETSAYEGAAIGLGKLQDIKDTSDLNKDIEQRISRLQAEASTLDMTREAAGRYLTAFDLIAEAKGKLKDGIVPQGEIDKLNAYASQMAAIQETIDKKADNKKWDDVTKGADKKLATLKSEQDSIGQSAQQTELLKYQTELLNDATQKGIDLSVTANAQGQTRREVLMQDAQTMANVAESTKEMKSALDLVQTSAQGFFDDMKTGLQNGEGIWKSFGTAVTNVLGKILDAIVNSGIKSLVSNLFDTTPGSTGVLGTIGKFLFSAKGNAFDSGGVTAFAKGGEFTNSVVSKPTPFMFAKGGAMGVMGEAGPEAVMPLHRGPDGSLGVRSAGGGGGDQNVQVNVINNNNSSVSTQSRRNSAGGLEIDVMIDQVASDKISDMSSSTNKALQARDARSMIRR